MNNSILLIHKKNTFLNEYASYSRFTIEHTDQKDIDKIIIESKFFSFDAIVVDLLFFNQTQITNLTLKTRIPIFVLCNDEEAQTLPSNIDYFTNKTPYRIIEQRLGNCIQGFFNTNVSAASKLNLLNSDSRYGFWEWEMDKDLFTFDKNAGIILANPDCSTYKQEIIYSRINPKDRPFTEHLFKAHKNNPKDLLQLDLRFNDFENKQKWLHCAGQILPATPQKMIGYIQDVSNIISVESELRDNEEKFRMIFETGNDGLFLVDIISDKILEVNEAGAKLFGYITNELAHKSFSQLWEDPDFIIETVKNQHLRIYSEFGKRTNGLTFPVDASFSYFMLNNALTLIASVRDVTERVEAEKRMIEAKEKAEESDRLKSAFLANMSHEIRTPLNAIVGFSRLLIRKSYSDDKRQVMITEIQSNSDQLLNIINDILDISKIESNQLDIECMDISSNELIDELYKPFKLHIKTHRKIIRLETETFEKDLYVYADPYRVKQIFSNLLNNAIKFTNEGFVRYGYLYNDAKKPVFFVEDSGKGIAKKNLEIIFEHFRQEDESYTRRYGGTGLGLSISKSLVELMGGQIWVESDKGKGAIFFFTLPRQKSEIKKVIKSAIANTDYTDTISNKKILFVDDVKNAFLIASEVLNEFGITVLYVDNGIKALEFLEMNEDIDLILMDIQMPVLNGIETTRKIKKHYPQIPIVAQTAYALKSDEKKFLSKGFDGYISKPIDIEKLVDVVARYINKENS